MEVLLPNESYGSPLPDLEWSEPSSLTLHSDDFWYNLIEMWNVSLALFRGYGAPESKDSVYKFIFGFRLYLPADEFLYK